MFLATWVSAGDLSDDANKSISEVAATGAIVPAGQTVQVKATGWHAERQPHGVWPASMSFTRVNGRCLLPVI